MRRAFLSALSSLVAGVAYCGDKLLGADLVPVGVDFDGRVKPAMKLSYYRLRACTPRTATPQDFGRESGTVYGDETDAKARLLDMTLGAAGLGFDYSEKSGGMEVPFDSTNPAYRSAPVGGVISCATVVGDQTTREAEDHCLRAVATTLRRFLCCRTPLRLEFVGFLAFDRVAYDGCDGGKAASTAVEPCVEARFRVLSPEKVPDFPALILD